MKHLKSNLIKSIFALLGLTLSTAGNLSAARADYFGPGALCTVRGVASFISFDRLHQIELNFEDQQCARWYSGAITSGIFSGTGGSYTVVIQSVSPNGRFGSASEDLNPIGENANVHDLSSAVIQRDKCLFENRQSYFDLLNCQRRYNEQVTQILYSSQQQD